MPCDAVGNFLPPGAPPLPRDDAHNWFPFEDRPAFEFAHHQFQKVEVSKGDLNETLRILLARTVLNGHEDDVLFSDAQEMLDTIDEIPWGDLPWHTLTLGYTGEVNDDVPQFKREPYTIFYRNALDVAEAMIGNVEFLGRFDTIPFEEYIGPNQRRWSNVMSGTHFWKQAVSLPQARSFTMLIYCDQDKIAEDPNTHGSMLVPVILGADKTTVSIATGNQHFHPVYANLGNIHNEMRRSHRDATIPLAFLAIPKGKVFLVLDSHTRC